MHWSLKKLNDYSNVEIKLQVVGECLLIYEHFKMPSYAPAVKEIK